MAASRRPRHRAFLNGYLAEMPNIAASMTTAALLFAIAVIFKPTITGYFDKPARDYPISCSADPVLVDTEHGETLSEFYIVNRFSDELNAQALQQKLTSALGDSGSNAVPDIVLIYGGADGKFISAAIDKSFNGNKGDLEILFRSDRIVIKIKKIAAAAILKIDIKASQFPLPYNSTRNAKIGLPFENTDYESTCYS